MLFNLNNCRFVRSQSTRWKRVKLKKKINANCERNSLFSHRTVNTRFSIHIGLTVTYKVIRTEGYTYYYTFPLSLFKPSQTVFIRVVLIYA